MKEFLIGAAAIAGMGPLLAQATAPAAPATPAPVIAPTPHALPEQAHSRDQLVQKVREHFVRLDTDRDGFLTRAEADAGRAHMRERIAHRLRDRAPRAPRADRDPNAAFDRLDRNRDGSISREEFAQGRELRVERREKRLERRADRAPRAMRLHRMGMLGGRLFDMADADRDGRVSLQEATDGAVRHFDQMDAHRDGQLTGDERRRMRHVRRAPTAG